MKLTRLSSLILACAALAGMAAQVHAFPVNEWRHRQTLSIPTDGLKRIELPPETLDAARSSLEDLRLLDSAGNEVPFLIERPTPRPGSSFRPQGFRYSADPAAQTTTVFVETGSPEPLVGVSLETSASPFLKPVRVEGSNDGELWQEIASGQLIFKQPGGAENRQISFEKSSWKFLRLTLDDRRSQPVPFTGARLHSPGSSAPTRSVAVAIKSRDESPRVSRIALDLGAANLPVASLRIETPELLFTRAVTFAVPEVTEQGIIEQPLGQAVIYRVGIDGKNEARLEIPLERQVHSRELILLIRNEDSPPLAITGVRAEQRLTRLVFLAREPGEYVLLTGNAQCPAPRYDLAALGPQLQSGTETNPAAPLIPSKLADNPEFKAPEALGALALTGAPLDAEKWQFRKPVQLAGAGVHQLELDLESMSNSAPDLDDLRLVRDGRQIPFLLEHPSISRALSVNANLIVVPKRPTLSRWSIKLPKAGLPIARIGCASPSPLFEREMRLWEEITGPRDEKYSRELGRATWRQTPGAVARELTIELNQPPQTDMLFLETGNGDNSAIELRDFRCFHPITRMIFKTTPDASQPLWLYYGNRETAAPRYDLSLIAGQLLRAEKLPATAGAQELATAKAAPRDEKAAESAGILFWCVLALVVVALLAIISRLLPKTDPA